MLSSRRTPHLTATLLRVRDKPPWYRNLVQLGLEDSSHPSHLCGELRGITLRIHFVDRTDSLSGPVVGGLHD